MKTEEPAEGRCFKRLAGMDLVFEPGCSGQKQGKKHPCADCIFCQHCAETRCLACRSERKWEKAAGCGKLSLREQILLYERVNAGAAEAK